LNKLEQILAFVCSVLVISACQNTPQSEPEFKVTPKIIMPSLEVNVEASATPESLIKAKETESTPLLERQLAGAKGVVITDSNQTLPAELRNKQICKEGVEVSYRLPDKNGYMNKYSAKIQLQGRLLALSPDKKSVKVKLWGWFSDNKNLQQWRMYLKQQPKAKSFSLVSGEEIWSETPGWYWCRFDDDKVLKI